jgi:hypothetical protein
MKFWLSSGIRVGKYVKSSPVSVRVRAVTAITICIWAVVLCHCFLGNEANQKESNQDDQSNSGKCHFARMNLKQIRLNELMTVVDASPPIYILMR